MEYQEYLLLVITLIIYHGTASSLQLKIRNEVERVDIEPSFSNVSTFKLYDFSYSPRNIVHISCMTNISDDSLQGYSMRWKIVDKNQILYVCEPEKGNQIHYITKFNAHSGNKLYCEALNNKKKTISVAEITLKCDPCPDYKSVSGPFLANCPYLNKERTIISYVNGNFSYLDRRLIKFKKSETITIHCLVMEEEKYTVEWKYYDKSIFRAGNFYDYGKLINIRFKKMPEDMDKQSITCLRTSNSKKSKVTFTFQLVSNLVLKVYDKNKNKTTWESYRENAILPYENNDDLELICEMVKQSDVHLYFFKDDTSSEHLKKPKRQVLKVNYYLGILTQANDSIKFSCEMISMSDTKSLDKRTVKLMFQKDEDIKTTTVEYGTTNGPTNDAVINLGSNVKWIAATGVLIGLFIITAGLIALWCRPSRVVEIRRPHENIYIIRPESQQQPTEPPEVQPTYGSPLDQYDYSYVSNNTRKGTQMVQETYCTPFVPTIEEMYAKPTPKKGKVKSKAEYDLASKYIRYANLKKSQNDDPDPGYSHLGDNNSDATSETYCLPHKVE